MTKNTRNISRLSVSCAYVCGCAGIWILTLSFEFYLPIINENSAEKGDSGVIFNKSEYSPKALLMNDGKEPPEIYAPHKKSVHMDVFIPHNTLVVQKASNYRGQFVALQPRSVLLSILNLP